MIFDKRKIIISIIVLVVVILVGLIITFRGYLPAVVISNSYISISEWNKGIVLAQKLDASLTSTAIADQMIKVKKEDKLLDKLSIKNDDLVAINELEYIKSDKSSEYDQLIKDYFDSDQNLFIQYIVKPEASDALLRIKYNSDFVANQTTYDRAKKILNEIFDVKYFDQIAQTESDDKITAQLGGDLGFVSFSQLIPELQKAVTASTEGSVKQEVVVSRLGYHILYPVETAEKNGQKFWHVKHILIKTMGFEDWLQPQLDKIFVWRIIY